MTKYTRQKIVVVILTYNRLKIFKDCLRSVLCQSYPIVKIIVINNFSNDGTAEFLDIVFRDNRIVYFNRNINDGPAGGFNFGIKEAFKYDPDSLLLVDDEVILEKHCLAELVKYLDHRTLVNSLILDYYNPKSIPFSLFDVKTGRGYANLSDIENLKTVNSLNPWNATLIPTGVFKEIGLIDENLFMRGEGDDFEHRAILAGFKFVTVCKSRAFMKKKDVSVRVFGKMGFISIPPPSTLYYMVRNTIILRKRYKKLRKQFRKYSSHYNFLYFKLPNIIYYPSYFLFLYIQGLIQPKDKLQYFKYLSKGILDGFRGKLGKYEMQSL